MQVSRKTEDCFVQVRSQSHQSELCGTKLQKVGPQIL